MNETECESLIKSVKWTDPTNLISLAILEFINVLVISGNLLVIAAVFCSNKLRSVTNFFIVNLAVADLLVGLAVLPFSATWEVFKVWIFGDVWCRIWLAVDVWMCTASILNLCAISLDRYVAVTRPVTYPSIMSKKRAKSLIAGIWVLSFVICFPPLIGWKDQKNLPQPLTYTVGNHTLFYATTSATRTTAMDAPITETFSTTWSNQTLAKLLRRSKRNHSNKTAMETKVKSFPAKHLHIHNAATTISEEIKIHINDYNNTHNIKVRNDALLPMQSANNDYNEYPNDNNNNNNNVITKPLAVYYEPTVSSTSSTSSPSSSAFTSTSAFASVSLPTSTKNQLSDESVFERTLNNKNNNQNKNINNNNKNNFNSNDDNVYEKSTNCPWKCELTNDRGYVLYSALGSFYIPMFVMLFFYWRIYRAAVRTTKAINQGFKTTKGGSTHDTNVNGVDESQLVLRIHRGRPCATTITTTTTNATTTAASSSISGLGMGMGMETSALTTSGSRITHRSPLASSTLSINCSRDEAHTMQLQQKHQQQHVLSKRASSLRTTKNTKNLYERVPLNNALSSTHSILENVEVLVTTAAATTTITKITTSSSDIPQSANVYNTLVHNLNDDGNRCRKTTTKTSLCNVNETTFNVDAVKCEKKENHLKEAIINRYDSDKRDSKKQRGKRSVKFQVKRFKVETKAAKTLAIIVGGFIFCWLPFFTMYLIRAFCDHCIQPTIFSILFWLGYCNSAINPLIYALFSHEFRIAFKRIICRCVCTRSGFRASENFQMIAARALMAPATFHKTISGCSDDGDGDGLYFS